jgi:hypothetical protein
MVSDIQFVSAVVKIALKDDWTTLLASDRDCRGSQMARTCPHPVEMQRSSTRRAPCATMPET